MDMTKQDFNNWVNKNLIMLEREVRELQQAVRLYGNCDVLDRRIDHIRDKIDDVIAII